MIYGSNAATKTTDLILVVLDGEISGDSDHFVQQVLMGGRLPAADVLSVGLGRRRRKGAAPDQVAGDVAELQRYTLGAEDFLQKTKINRSINQSVFRTGGKIELRLLCVLVWPNSRFVSYGPGLWRIVVLCGAHARSRGG